MTSAVNDILILKGDLSHDKHKAGGGGRGLRKKAKVASSHLKSLADDLRSVLRTWDFALLHSQVLVTADYREIVAKTNRIERLLKPRGCQSLSSRVCGARFEADADTDALHHVIVYKTTPEAVRTSIAELDRASQFLDAHCAGFVTDETLKTVSKAQLAGYDFSFSAFRDLIVDAYFAKRFRIGSVSESAGEDMLVSLYRVGSQSDLIHLLSQIGIRTAPSQFLNDDTVYLTPEERELLREKAGWLIAMEVRDLMDYDTAAELSPPEPAAFHLPDPVDEPVVGVIDTRFDAGVYFSKWVEYHDCINKNIPVAPEDFRHGTAVTSLIVNGPVMNPGLDDGCGFFRVRHFAVAPHGSVSSFEVMRHIRKIVRENPDIRVWNLSLGSRLPCPENFVSPEGAELDRLQREFDVLFVVAGTNASSNASGALPQMRIGSPADAVNPVVVNSCDEKGNPAPYSRRGPVLNFFRKPDVSCPGGVAGSPVYACTACGREPFVGTSFAAPWIARKLAYMIEKLRLSRTEAKALLIDACIGWEKGDHRWPWRGWGCVPRRIEDVVHCAKSEIRFVVSGNIEDYETFSYNIPVPKTTDEKYDYDVRATLCYFPECQREQGVDYTLTELDLHFGRVDGSGAEPAIRSIDENKQGDDAALHLPESLVRNYFRKWDNIKVRRRIYKRMLDPLNPQGLWGLKIYSKERTQEKHGQKMPFSLVVTLRSRQGENRQAAFLKACQARGWIVHSLNVEAMLAVSAKLSEDVLLED